ncbi:MAG: class III lanthionine synthetase LanKC [Burkholderiaceae bacterium]|nr:class III lanthionine synthetase LanKC [Burkholderiaceae bacterium]
MNAPLITNYFAPAAATSKTAVDDPHFYTPQSAYQPGREYYDCATALLKSQWRIQVGSFWTQLVAPIRRHPVQGWKIHVSATPDSAKRILAKVAPVCIAHETEFKFASDEKILRQLLSKNCTRQSSGKFITIYPPSDALFRQLLDELYPLLQDETGPYILSDRRYKDSHVLHYRYGGFKSFPETNAKGEVTMRILDDKFQYMEDIRAAQFVLPPFIDDGFSEAPRASQHDAAQAPSVFGGDYHIEGVIKHSNAGGVYLGRHRGSGEPVIIKEARPFIGLNRHGVDNICRLRKEYRMLTKIAAENIAPKPYKLFQEWEHVFYAQELVAGKTLRQWSVANNKLIHNDVDSEKMRVWRDQVMRIAIALIDMIAVLHRHNIVFGDLSLNNVMIDFDTLTLKLIDFEGAFEPGVDAPTNLYTPGYGRMSRMERDGVEFADDYYALGNMLLALLAPNPTVNQVNEDFARAFFDDVRAESGLPDAFGECMQHLLTRNDADLAQCAAMLRSAELLPVPPRCLAQFAVQPDPGFYTEALRQVFDFNMNMLDLGKSDRILPLAPKMVDALAVDRGMLGVAYAWHAVRGGIPDELRQWIARHWRPVAASPGLSNGLGGAAWVLSELGFEKQAHAAMGAAGMHRQLFLNMSLGYGAAGYGMANLYFWERSRDLAYLTQACKMADILCESAIEHAQGLAWEDPHCANGAAVGLQEGASGIALFLLYMYCTTLETRYLTVGEQGLAFDLACGRETGGSLGFPRRSGADSRILLPYLAQGSAGVGCVALRYHAVTGKAHYRQVAEQVTAAVAHKYTVVPGLHNGLAGLGTYLLDAHQFLQDDACLKYAHRVAQGIKLFRIERDGGCIFPGLDQGKLITDYADGSAGIAMFLHRLLHGGGNTDFTLDGLLMAGKAGAVARHTRDKA